MKHLLIFLLIVEFACATTQGPKISVEGQDNKSDKKTEGSIGVATMKDDGAIVLRLKAKSPRGAAGEGILVYPPTHPDYQSILSHIGPIRKGQTVPVKPWPD
jgi:hypothetical protein